MNRDEPTLIQHFLEQSARRAPGKVALVQDERRVSYARINDLAERLAAWLRVSGVARGDRVVILLGNGLEYVIAYYGILKAGAVAVPLNPELKPAGLQPILAQLEPAAVILDWRQKTTMAQFDLAGMGIGNLLVVDNRRQLSPGFCCQVTHWDTALASSVEARPPAPANADDLASIIFTSGSTGTPKGVMLSHRNIVANTDSIVRYLQLGPDDIQMVVLPFFYVMGKSLLNTHFAVGGRVVINNRFAFPAAVVKEMIDEAVTGFSGVPSTYSYLLHKSPLADCRDQLTSLRYCSQAGGHMPRSTKETLLQALPEQTRLFVMYGATEASARLAYVEPEQLRAKIDSIGRPIPGVTLKVVDEHGVELPCRQVGEIVAAGANIASGYWRDPQATGAAFGPHGYRTGDLGYRDEDGYYFLAGRKDHQLKVGGHRINPVEIEEALMMTGLCIEVLVLGLDNPLSGQSLAAMVVPRNSDCTEQQLIKACAMRLPRHKLPGQIACVAALAKHANGKIDRERCREALRQQAVGEPSTGRENAP